MSERATLSQAYRQGLAEEMRTDPRILVYGTDLFERGGHWGQVRGLGSEFGLLRFELAFLLVNLTCNHDCDYDG